MKLSELIKNELICLEKEETNKTQAIEKLVSLNESAGTLFDAKSFLREVLKREAEFSTELGYFATVPHAMSACVKTPSVSVLASGEKLYFLISLPQNSEALHIEILSRLSTLLLNDDFRKQLKEAKTQKEIISIIQKAEKEL